MSCPNHLSKQALKEKEEAIFFAPCKTTHSAKVSRNNFSWNTYVIILLQNSSHQKSGPFKGILCFHMILHVNNGWCLHYLSAYKGQRDANKAILCPEQRSDSDQGPWHAQKMFHPLIWQDALQNWIPHPLSALPDSDP